MLSESIYYQKPTFNFVLEILADKKNLSKFYKECIKDGCLDFSPAVPEQHFESEGDERKWRLSHWGSSKLPKVQTTQVNQDKLVINATSEIGFPVQGLKAVLDKYGLLLNRGICVAADKSEAFVLGNNKKESLVSRRLSKKEMVDYHILSRC